MGEAITEETSIDAAPNNALPACPAAQEDTPQISTIAGTDHEFEASNKKSPPPSSSNGTETSDSADESRATVNGKDEETRDGVSEGAGEESPVFAASDARTERSLLTQCRNPPPPPSPRTHYNGAVHIQG